MRAHTIRHRTSEKKSSIESTDRIVSPQKKETCHKKSKNIVRLVRELRLDLHHDSRLFLFLPRHQETHKPDPRQTQAQRREMELESYCEKVRCGILKYCLDLKESSLRKDEEIFSVVVGETLEWCKYEAFCYGFEEILSNEKVSNEQSEKLEALGRQLAELKGQEEKNQLEIRELREKVNQNQKRMTTKGGNGRRNSLGWDSTSYNKENRSRFPVIDLQEI
jgi:hypothetical protein